jgi:hypothetical protein
MLIPAAPPDGAATLLVDCVLIPRAGGGTTRWQMTDMRTAA